MYSRCCAQVHSRSFAAVSISLGHYCTMFLSTLSSSKTTAILLTIGSLFTNINGQQPGTNGFDLIARKTSLWPGRQIPVCWVPRTGKQYTTEKGWTRSAVFNTWASSTHDIVTFTGWGECTTNQKAIRIRITDAADDAPHTLGLGTELLLREDYGMSLNFEFKNWCPQCIVSQSREAAIRIIAVHEFGHALGFGHEHAQPGAKPTSMCSKEDIIQAQERYGNDYPVSKYDYQSVMNYCNENWNGGGSLSTLDVKGFLTLYKSLQGYYGSCTLASGPRSLVCVAAASRYCSSALSKDVGFTQAIIKATPEADTKYGVLCARSSLLGWVPWNQIPNCQGYSQYMTCFASLSSYCLAKASSSIGIIQETRSDSAKVACVKADSRWSVSVSTLKSYNSACTSISLAQSVGCTTAAVLYCRSKSGAGYAGAVIYGIDGSLFKVGCVYNQNFKHVRVEKGF